jgi:hypothetical protein
MNDEMLNKIIDLMAETRGKFESVDRLAREVSGVNLRLDRIEGRLDRIEGDVKEIKSELGTVKGAVLDIGRKGSEHDVAIKELQSLS